MRFGRWGVALWVLCSGVLLPGCSIIAEMPINEVVPVDDSFRPYRSYRVQLPQEAGQVPPTELGDLAAILLFDAQLDGRVDRQTQAHTIKLIVLTGYLGRVQYRYHQARDEQAGQLPLVVVRRQAECPMDKEKPCTYKEVFEIDVPETGLRKATDASYRIKVFAGIGPDLTVTIPPPAIRNLLASFDNDKPGATAVAAASKTR